MKYTCPMHPQIQSDKPGTCPLCGMKLILESHISENHSIKHQNLQEYTPLLIIIGLLFLVTTTLSFKDFLAGGFALQKTISYFMMGFFLVFSGFKLIDLKGFADGYNTYDLLAQRLYSYGYLYPFIELFFGLAMIVIPQAKWLLIAELLLMTFSGLGVTIKLLRKEKFQCVCLGTFLKVPLTKITLIEDFGMALLAAISLYTL